MINLSKHFWRVRICSGINIIILYIHTGRDALCIHWMIMIDDSNSIHILPAFFLYHIQIRLAELERENQRLRLENVHLREA